MTDFQTMKKSFHDYKPTKTLFFWSCAGCIVATTIVGFTVGGWVTGGTAQERAENAALEARAELAANVCVERFASAPQFATELAALKDERRWRRRSMIEDGGWVTFADMENPVEDAADLCAARLAEMEVPETVTEASAPADADASGMATEASMQTDADASETETEAGAQPDEQTAPETDTEASARPDEANASDVQTSETSES